MPLVVAVPVPNGSATREIFSNYVSYQFSNGIAPKETFWALKATHIAVEALVRPVSHRKDQAR